MNDIFINSSIYQTSAKRNIVIKARDNTNKIFVVPLFKSLLNHMLYIGESIPSSSSNQLKIMHTEENLSIINVLYFHDQLPCDILYSINIINKF